MQFQTAFDPIRALSASWGILKRAPIAILIGGTAVLMLTDGDEGAALQRLWEGEVHVRWEDLSEFIWQATIGAASFLTEIVLLLLACFFVTSYAGTVERVVRTGSGQSADLLNARGRFAKQVLASLLGEAILVVGLLPMWLLYELFLWVGVSIGAGWIVGVGLVFLLVLWLPAIAYLYLGLRFVAQAVAFENLGPIDALRRSWSLVDGNRWSLALYLVVVNIFAALGVLACGVGVLVTGTMKVAAINESYLRLITSDEEQASWGSESEPVA